MSSVGVERDLTRRRCIGLVPTYVIRMRNLSNLFYYISFEVLMLNSKGLEDMEELNNLILMHKIEGSTNINRCSVLRSAHV